MSNNNDQEEKQGQGFTVTDKRFTSKSTEEKEQILHEKEVHKDEETLSPQPKQEQLKQDSQPAPEEVTFSGLIFSLSHSAMIQMGDVPNPITQKQEKDLPSAKQSIDLIALLQEKTKGNLSKEEDMLLTNVLYDLRMRFVQNSSLKGQP